jgi:hypothetical protein
MEKERLDMKRNRILYALTAAACIAVMLGA